MTKEKDLFVFVVGNSRSGTTMMGRIVSNNPDIYFFNELHYFEELAATNDLSRILNTNEARRLFLRLLTIQRDGYLSQDNPEKYQDEVAAILPKLPKKVRSVDVFTEFLKYECQRSGKKYPCDQTPQNVFYIKEILELIPEARIINMIRDPRDVLLSQKRRWRRRFRGTRRIPLSQKFRYWVNYHPITITKLWNASLRGGDAYVDHAQVFQLRFRDLVQNPEENVRALCKFLGVTFHEVMLKVPQIGSSSGVERPDRKSIDPSVAGRWKRGGLSQAELYLCEKIARKNIEKHGYEFSDAKPAFLALIFIYLLFPLKLAVAFILNLKRMRSISETLKRRLR